MVIQLLKGEADTLLALRGAIGKHLSAYAISQMMYPGKDTEGYYQKVRNRLQSLVRKGLVSMKAGIPGKVSALYSITSAGMSAQIEITVHDQSKKDAANAKRAAFALAFQAELRGKRASEDEQATDRWAAMPPVRVRVDAASAPRVSHAALRHASVFAWAGQ